MLNLRITLLAERSKAQTTRIIKWIGSDQKRFDELFHLFLNDEYRVVQRAAWPLSYCVISNPQLIRKHFAKLVKSMKKPSGIENDYRRSLGFRNGRIPFKSEKNFEGSPVIFK
jgi:hypothetical protein